MPKKDYVMIGTDILEHWQFRELKTCRERNAYLPALLSSPANYIGTFRYPITLFSREANIDQNDLLSVIELLEAAELIEYDRKQEYIRLTDWFYSSNITVSEKTVRGAARDFLKRGVPRIELVSRSIAEFVVGSLLGVKAYREKSTHGPVVIAELKDFLVEATLTFPNLESCLYREMVRRGAAVKAAYGDVFLGVVQGEALEQRQIDSTVEIGSTGGPEAPSIHNTKPYLTQNQIYTEPAARETGNEQPNHEKNLLGPMQSTLDSALVQVSKKKKIRC